MSQLIVGILIGFATTATATTFILVGMNRKCPRCGERHECDEDESNCYAMHFLARQGDKPVETFDCEGPARAILDAARTLPDSAARAAIERAASDMVNNCYQ